MKTGLFHSTEVAINTQTFAISLVKLIGCGQMLNIHTGGTTEYGDDDLLIEKLN
jgi:hypothetical protein